MLSEAIYKTRYLLVIAFSDLVAPKGAVLFVVFVISLQILRAVGRPACSQSGYQEFLHTPLHLSFPDLVWPCNGKIVFSFLNCCIWQTAFCFLVP